RSRQRARASRLRAGRPHLSRRAARARRGARQHRPPARPHERHPDLGGRARPGRRAALRIRADLHPARAAEAAPRVHAAFVTPFPAHAYHSLTVVDVIDETADTKSFVLEIPAALADTFAYAAGQFCTFRAVIGGEPIARCYSMSSSPVTGDPFTTTVKRMPG